MADDDTFVVGAPLPRIAAVTAHGGLRVVVTWASDGPGAAVQAVDLAPAVFRYRVYAPLRDDPALFSVVRVADDGFALAWGDGDDLDMASTTVAEMAEQAMTPADFGAFMKRNGYTLDGVAAELGISRRLAAYYAKDREVPRHIALACRYLDQSRAAGATPALHRDLTPDNFLARARASAGSALDLPEPGPDYGRRMVEWALRVAAKPVQSDPAANLADNLAGLVGNRTRHR